MPDDANRPGADQPGGRRANAAVPGEPRSRRAFVRQALAAGTAATACCGAPADAAPASAPPSAPSAAPPSAPSAAAAAGAADARAGGPAPTLPGVNEALAEFVTDGEIAGAVTVVADRDGLRHVGAVGRADIAADRPMAADALFWIASMTKPVTGVAVMMLVDEGRLRLSDPIADYIPEFAGLVDPAGRPAAITLEHALTHTSGLGDVPRQQAQQATSLAELLPPCLAQPLKFTPGTKWSYCQTGINAAARVVEIVTGAPFQDVLEQRLFGPLGMRDTTFFPDDDRCARLATTYRVSAAERRLVPDKPGLDVTNRRRVALANGGLFSTGPDYVRFARMLLGRGAVDGRRYLSAAAVDTLASDLTGPLAAGFVPGSCWGVATAVVREPQGVTATLAPGSFGHGGAHGTQAWIDPVRGVAQILLFLRSDVGNSDGSPMRERFHAAVARAVAP